MLASTVQFSTNNQPLPHTTPPDPSSPQGPQRYEIGTAPDETTTHTPQSAARSLRTQQRAYGPPSPPTNPAPRTPPVETRECSTRGRRTSRRPNWSAFHP